jgi:uncharacterized membrane-anchored protein
MNKLPHITLAFWVMKICATTLGETAADLLSKDEKLGYGVAATILISAFAALVTAQLRVKKYIPFLFWAVILATSTAGTAMSDYMDRTLNLGYGWGSVILLSLLLTTLLVWWCIERSLSVDNIKTRRAESLYWTAILFSNTLGTAMGDFFSSDKEASADAGGATGAAVATPSGAPDSEGWGHLSLGYVGVAELMGGLLVLLAAAYFIQRRFWPKSSKVALFWVAFVLTRPFGAAAGDVLARSKDEGCLGFGTKASSAVLAAILLAVILYTTWRPGKTAPLADASTAA